MSGIPSSASINQYAKVACIDKSEADVSQTLERVSEAFKDLFAVPQPEDEALLDGCPVVRLEGDSGQDWTSLLDAIYDSL